MLLSAVVVNALRSSQPLRYLFRTLSGVLAGKVGNHFLRKTIHCVLGFMVVQVVLVLNPMANLLPKQVRAPIGTWIGAWIHTAPRRVWGLQHDAILLTLLSTGRKSIGLASLPVIEPL